MDIGLIQGSLLCLNTNRRKMNGEKNIATKDILSLHDEIRKVESFMHNAISWVEDSPNVSNKTMLTKRLKSYRRSVRTVEKSFPIKPALALFGASQSGKSHLVKNLLQNKNDKKLYVVDNQRGLKIDYLKSMNPEGEGNESTALVTRFVLAKQAPNPERKPIQLQLLSIKELILCVIDGFYSVSNFDDYPFEYAEEVAKATADLKSKSGELIQILKEDDIFYLKEYINKYKQSNAIQLYNEFENQNFWEELERKADILTVDDIISIFNLFWLGHKEFTALFRKLAQVLAKLNFTDHVFVDFDLLLRNIPNEYTDVIQRSTNILDVKTLDNILDGTSGFKVEDEDGNEYELTDDIICAISKEVILELDIDNIDRQEFLSKVDVLDFPGVRPGTTIHLDRVVEKKDLAQAILRGKVNFLFNSYSDELLINNLAIVTAIAEQKDGAKEIPQILENWIEHYIGDSTAERKAYLSESHYNPLFIILTFWNKILHYDAAKHNIDPGERFEKAFGTRLYEDIRSNAEWMDNWDGKGEPFKNFYLLRDFNYCGLYERDNHDHEQDIKNDQEEFFINCKNHFYEMRKVRSIFSDPEKAWRESTMPNKDGSQYIIENLFKAASNISKTKRLLNIVKKQKEQFENLFPKPHKNDLQSKIKEARRKAEDIATRLGLYMECGNAISEIKELFTISEIEIHDKLINVLKSHEVINTDQLKPYFTFLLQYPEINDYDTKEEKLNALKDRFGYDTTEEMEGYLTQSLNFDLNKLFDHRVGQLTKKSNYVAEVICKHWINLKLNTSFDHFQDDHITPSTLEQISIILQNNFMQLDMVNKVAQSIGKFIDEGELNDEAYFMVANIIYGHINEFVNTAGKKFMQSDELNELLGRADEYNFNLKILDASVEENMEEMIDESLEEVYDYLEKKVESINSSIDKNVVAVIQRSPSLHSWFSWQDSLKLALLANIESVEYDLESNNQLASIYEDYNNMDISLKLETS